MRPPERLGCGFLRCQRSTIRTGPGLVHHPAYPDAITFSSPWRSVEKTRCVGDPADCLLTFFNNQIINTDRHDTLKIIGGEDSGIRAPEQESSSGGSR